MYISTNERRKRRKIRLRTRAEGVLHTDRVAGGGEDGKRGWRDATAGSAGAVPTAEIPLSRPPAAAEAPQRRRRHGRRRRST